MRGQRDKTIHRSPKPRVFDRLAVEEVRGQGSSAHAVHEERLETGNLQEGLQRFYETMQEDHANTVRWLLYDARKAIEDREPLFMDEVSPFASLEPDHVTPESVIPDEYTTVNINFYVSFCAMDL